MRKHNVYKHNTSLQTCMLDSITIPRVHLSNFNCGHTSHVTHFTGKASMSCTFPGISPTMHTQQQTIQSNKMISADVY
jgi:hypothetical protein